jgi:hypothetical protein
MAQHLVQLLLFQSCCTAAAAGYCNCWQVLSTLSPLQLHSLSYQSSSQLAVRRRRRRTENRQGRWHTGTITALAAVEPGPPKPLGRQQGVYVRPSAAIERGSGFFIPGLEGPKVRLLFGSLLLGWTILNHGLSSVQQNQGNVVAESLAALYSLLVLFQGAIEFFKTQNSASKSLLDPTTTTTTIASTAGVSLLQQQWLVRVEDTEWRNRVEWAASTYVVLTPATAMLLVSRQQVVFSLDTSSVQNQAIPANDTTLTTPFMEAQATGCAAALETLGRSKSGRVALPMQHPTVTSLGLHQGAQSKTNRCVVLQRVNDQLCWIMTSDQLLVSFTQQDLQWLGQLARYIDPIDATDAHQ